LETLIQTTKDWLQKRLCLERTLTIMFGTSTVKTATPSMGQTGQTFIIANAQAVRVAPPDWRSINVVFRTHPDKNIGLV
jgi:hypothetical protein